MSSLSSPQARELVLVLRSGGGTFPAMDTGVRNSLIASRLISYNVVTNRVELTRDGLLVAQTLIATDDDRL